MKPSPPNSLVAYGGAAAAEKRWPVSGKPPPQGWGNSGPDLGASARHDAKLPLTDRPDLGLGSFPNIHERLLSARSGHSDQLFRQQSPVRYATALTGK